MAFVFNNADTIIRVKKTDDNSTEKKQGAAKPQEAMNSIWDSKHKPQYGSQENFFNNTPNQQDQQERKKLSLTC